MAKKKTQEEIDREIEDKIRKILTYTPLTAFQRLWLKTHKPYIYKYLPCSSLVEDIIYRKDAIQTVSLPDTVKSYVDEVGDFYSTRIVKSVSNWTLERLRYAGCL